MLTAFKEYPQIPVPAWLQALGSDGSWHNDAMPHAWIWIDEKTFRGVEIWVNFPKPADREIGDRWEILLLESENQYHNQDGEVLYQGDDEALAVEAVNRGLGRLGSWLKVVAGDPIAGVWTPWAQILCRACHDSLPSDATAKRKINWPEGEKAEGDDLCLCTECGRSIWVAADIAQLARLHTNVGGELEQTGGMCAALVIPRGDKGTVVVTNLDGPLSIGRYAPGEWEEGAEAEQEYCLPVATPDDLAAAVIAVVLLEPLEAK
jgi:hypothetical protein